MEAKMRKGFGKFLGKGKPGGAPGAGEQPVQPGNGIAAGSQQQLQGYGASLQPGGQAGGRTPSYSGSTGSGQNYAPSTGAPRPHQGANTSTQSPSTYATNGQQYAPYTHASQPQPQPQAQPDHSAIFRDRGLELSMTGDFDSAIIMYNNALMTQPSDPIALLYRSFAYVLKQSPRLDLAAADADAIIQLDPTNFKAWKQKADVLRRQSDLRGAVEALNNAIGCASGMDRLEVQGVLNDVQRQLAQQQNYLPSPINYQPQNAEDRHSAQLSSSHAPTMGELQTPVVHQPPQQPFMPSPILPRESFIPSPIGQTPRHSAQLSNSTVPTQDISGTQGLSPGSPPQGQAFLPPPSQTYVPPSQQYHSSQPSQETATNYSYSATPPPQQNFPPPASQETLTAQTYDRSRASSLRSQEPQKTFMPPQRQATPSGREISPTPLSDLSPQKKPSSPPPQQSTSIKSSIFTPATQLQEAPPGNVRDRQVTPPPQRHFSPSPSSPEKLAAKDLPAKDSKAWGNGNSTTQKQSSPPQPKLATLNSSVYGVPRPSQENARQVDQAEDPPLVLKYRTTSPPEQTYIPSPPLTSKKNDPSPSRQFDSTSSTPEPPSAGIYQLPADEPQFLPERPKNRNATSPTPPSQITAESSSVPTTQRKSVGSPASPKGSAGPSILPSPKESVTASKSQESTPTMPSSQVKMTPPTGFSQQMDQQTKTSPPTRFTPKMDKQVKTTPPTAFTPQMDQQVKTTPPMVSTSQMEKTSPKVPFKPLALSSSQPRKSPTPPNTLPEINKEPPIELPYTSSPPLKPVPDPIEARRTPSTQVSPPPQPVLNKTREILSARSDPASDIKPPPSKRPPPSDLSKPMPPPPSDQSTASNETTARPDDSRESEEPDANQFVQPETRANTGTQPVRQPQVTRTYNAETVTQAPNAQALPFGGEDLMNVPPLHEPPAGYTPPPPMSVTEVNRRLEELTVTLAGKNKGSLSIRPYTTADGIDAIQLLYVGMVQGELTQREIGRPTYLHPTFNSMVVDNYGYPGSTWLDMDPESSAYYEGKLPGTVGISGYSEEYRMHQLIIQPLLNLSLEGSAPLREVNIDNVVAHMRRVQLRPNVEDDEGLKTLLGLSAVEAVQWGFSPSGTRQKRIDNLCLALNRSLYFYPDRFIDFAKSRNFSQHTLGSAGQGIGMQNFLFQILIGAELLIRLRKEPAGTNYKGIVTDNVSALLVLSSLWMQHVTVQGPKEGAHRYLIYAHDQQRHAEALIRFAEAMAWPFMDEARAYIENAYTYLTSGTQPVGFDICDWLYGLILPGKIYRHRLMSCLVYSSPSLRHLNAAPYFENGLVVSNKSYWPKRTVLARVLGGLRNPKAICGWVGPFPSPSDTNITGWVRLSARRVDVPTPVTSNGGAAGVARTGGGGADALASYGFDTSLETTSQIVEALTNPAEWIIPSPPFLPPADPARALFRSLDLTLIPPSTTTNAETPNPELPQEEYRASLTFEIVPSASSGASGPLMHTYTLYSNPVFVSAPPCVGNHIMHARQVERYLGNTVRVADLKDVYPENWEGGGVVVINALAMGEEAVARAWCAERGRHAVVRRGEGCCYACAIGLAEAERGTGVGVVIWSR